MMKSPDTWGLKDLQIIELDFYSYFTQNLNFFLNPVTVQQCLHFCLLHVYFFCVFWKEKGVNRDNYFISLDVFKFIAVKVNI